MSIEKFSTKLIQFDIKSTTFFLGPYQLLNKPTREQSEIVRDRRLDFRKLLSNDPDLLQAYSQGPLLADFCRRDFVFGPFIGGRPENAFFVESSLSGRKGDCLTPSLWKTLLDRWDSPLTDKAYDGGVSRIYDGQFDNIGYLRVQRYPFPNARQYAEFFKGEAASVANRMRRCLRLRVLLNNYL